MGMSPIDDVSGDRKRRVLCAVIEAYIKTGEPVGSKIVVERFGGSVSSATIRSEMAELSVMGYLEQPHTSAGRIPTAAAFRLYIDKLMPRQPLTQKDRLDIDGRLSRVLEDPARLLDEASQALAETTGCAAVSTTPSAYAAEILRIDVFRVSEYSAAILMMTNTGMLRSRVCRFNRKITTAALERLSNMLMAAFGRCLLSDVTLPQVQSLITALAEDALVYASALTAFYQLVQESAAAEVILSGQLNLLSHPDYPPERIRDLFSFLTQREMLSGLLTSIPHGLRVVLGGESPRPELDGTSIIVTRYSLGGDIGSGRIGIIGPLRMNYASAIPRLEYFAKAISKALEELAAPDSASCTGEEWSQ